MLPAPQPWTHAQRLALAEEICARLRVIHVVRFLEHLLAHVPGTLLVLWDGAPIHRGQSVEEFLATPAATRLRHERHLIRGCIHHAGYQL